MLNFLKILQIVPSLVTICSGVERIASAHEVGVTNVCAADRVTSKKEKCVDVDSQKPPSEDILGFLLVTTTTSRASRLCGILRL